MTETNEKVNETVSEELPEEEVKKENETIEEIKEEKKKKGFFNKKEDSKVKELQEEIIQLNDKLAAAKNEYYKAYADTENMKKRLQAEFDSRNKYRIQSFAMEILPAIDNLERALANCEKESPLYVGVNMVYQQLMLALQKEGVEEIPAEGLPFDSNVHNALMIEKVEGTEPNMVLEVLQKGYKLKDRILRATLVKVSE